MKQLVNAIAKAFILSFINKKNMEEVDIILQRYSDNGDSTLGLLFIENEFYCYTLEDEFRAIKVKGETRIPAGRYELKIREELTGLTKKYRKKYDWFHYHIQVMDVKDFNYVYIHVGNYQENTDGCLLLGDSANNNQIEKGMISKSMPAFKRFYSLIYPVLEQGNKRVFIDVRDEVKV